MLLLLPYLHICICIDLSSSNYINIKSVSAHFLHQVQASWRIKCTLHHRKQKLKFSHFPLEIILIHVYTLTKFNAFNGLNIDRHTIFSVREFQTICNYNERFKSVIKSVFFVFNQYVKIRQKSMCLKLNTCNCKCNPINSKMIFNVLILKSFFVYLCKNRM